MNTNEEYLFLIFTIIYNEQYFEEQQLLVAVRAVAKNE